MEGVVPSTKDQGNTVGLGSGKKFSFTIKELSIVTIYFCEQAQQA